MIKRGLLGGAVVSMLVAAASVAAADEKEATVQKVETYVNGNVKVFLNGGAKVCNASSKPYGFFDGSTAGGQNALRVFLAAKLSGKHIYIYSTFPSGGGETDCQVTRVQLRD